MSETVAGEDAARLDSSVELGQRASLAAVARSNRVAPRRTRRRGGRPDRPRGSDVDDRRPRDRRGDRRDRGVADRQRSPSPPCPACGRRGDRAARVIAIAVVIVLLVLGGIVAQSGKIGEELTAAAGEDPDLDSEPRGRPRRGAGRERQRQLERARHHRNAPQGRRPRRERHRLVGVRPLVLRVRHLHAAEGRAGAPRVASTGASASRFRPAG